MTFAEFEKLPEPEGFRYELHQGELVKVTYPLYPHVRVQWQLRRLLEKAAGNSGFVDKELPYRPLPEHEAWSADVAYLPRERWDHIDRYLEGAPELVVEVLSPSNTAAEIRDERKLCLANGSVEFWIADPEQHEIEVHTRDGRAVTYGAGQQIPLFFAGGTFIPADAIFA